MPAIDVEDDIVLVNISGADQPNITTAVSATLARYDINILDISQAEIHQSLSLGLLIQLPANTEASQVLKDLLYQAHELNLTVKFTPISLASDNDWVATQGKARYIVTLLARTLNAQQIAEVSRVIYDQGLTIDNITRLSGRPDLSRENRRTKACVELSVRGTPHDLNQLRAAFMQIANQLAVDIAFQEDNAFRRNRRLVAFDMDSTLIEAEVIDELAKAAGVGQEVAAITEQAMQGEIDFNESFRRRVALLKGLDEGVLQGIAEQLPLTEGAEKLVAHLKSLGFKTAILSGGFNYFGRMLQEKLGIDYVHANELEISNGQVTGEVVGEIVDGNRKASLLKEIAARENIRLEQVIAVGDGANDLPMLNAAGLGIAFRAKPIVKQSAKQAISTLGLDGILYLIGFRDRDQLS